VQEGSAAAREYYVSNLTPADIVAAARSGVELSGEIGKREAVFTHDSGNKCAF
jgi:hypothetical protein